ncbi:unnamed protein product [Vitrella brassicaformis CCMP3155]|uniref:Uncharacterized protein n=1 Tax=Vitrella brassicaformis (strain CCMP3155) TaxID=1169540 RepID=A0A0G4GX33_VITBC|nr:unnamed protein product [Vitrella brassicaformis CCMP3155]|mmetsp:Transcript_15627/g.44682  ORF Transcript_15627/g.44682 Transcript_15627/m.44682 type:complete len:133 (+) Transcript_15627:314-712(+)|eukprot:CEM35578.1 unnamed protein product [Vitrella brassicaformis CCMP3155]
MSGTVSSASLQTHISASVGTPIGLCNQHHRLSLAASEADSELAARRPTLADMRHDAERMGQRLSAHFMEVKDSLQGLLEQCSDSYVRCALEQKGVHDKLQRDITALKAEKVSLARQLQDMDQRTRRIEEDIG